MKKKFYHNKPSYTCEEHRRLKLFSKKLSVEKYCAANGTETTSPSASG